MRKFTLTVTLVIITALSLQAQFFFLGKENAHIYQGGENGKNFAAILSTNNTTRQESIRQCVQFLSKYKIITNEKAVLASLKEYNDTQNEFTVPVMFRYGWHGSAPTMGAVAPIAPMYLTADLRFQFYDDKVRLVIQNLGEKAYFDCAILSKSNKKTPETVLSGDDYEKFKGYLGAPAMQDGMGGFFTKILVWANSGLDKVKEVDKVLDEFMDNIDDQIRLVDILVDEGVYFLGTPDEVVAFVRKMGANNDLRFDNHLQTMDLLEKEIAQEKLVFVYPKFWKQDVKLEFDYFFIAFNNFFGGEIEGIAEDGEQTWELVDGKLLPTDPKFRKQIIKNKQDYFSYYGN